MSWRAILEGELADAAASAIEDIASALPTLVPEHPNIAHGSGGIALFFAYHGLVCESDEADRIANEIGASVIAKLQMAAAPMFYGGYPGCGWLLEHIFGEDTASDEDDIGRPFDDRLGSLLSSQQWRADYDLIVGLTGFAVAMLERRGKGNSRANLERIVFHLANLAEQQAGGTTWHTAPELLVPAQLELAPAGYYNLGAAHGVPGTLRILAAAAKEPFSIAAAEALADGAASWILANKLGDEYESDYPTIRPESREPQESRIGWCYGDLGVAATLIAAGRDLDRAEWIAEGQATARRVAHRDPVAGMVRDSGLCHGAIGIAHLYNRMHQATGDEELLSAALNYYRLGLSMREVGAGIAGFTELHFDDDSGPDDGVYRGNPGFLTGAAGIGLALLAATSDTEPDWDRLLVCDATPLGSE